MELYMAKLACDWEVERLKFLIFVAFQIHHLKATEVENEFPRSKSNGLSYLSFLVFNNGHHFRYVLVAEFFATS